MNNTEVLQNLQQKFSIEQEHAKILVVGLGKTGMSVASYLRNLGLDFALVDSRKKPPFNEQLLANMPDVPVFTGRFEPSVFALATHLVVSPGISMQEPVIQQALARGVIALSDIDLFACSTHKPIIAITGSNGKSTVTTLLGVMAKEQGVSVGVGGNLGTPALDLLDKSVQLYILELSSFQLERTTQLNAVASTVLNISEDHLDRYAGMDAYIQQKYKVFAGDGVMVINLDDAVVLAMNNAEREVKTFSLLDEQADYHLMNVGQERYLAVNHQPILSVKEMKLLGRHNQANALAALALGQAVNFSDAAMCSALKQYSGLQHRMQFIADIKGVRWVNDSKATNVGACIAALEGIDGQDIILIAGGDAKGADMQPLVPLLKSKVKQLVLIGKDSALIKQAVKTDLPVIEAVTLDKAIELSYQLSQAGDTVLLSPACASLDQFVNYQERGRSFSLAVKALEQ